MPKREDIKTILIIGSGPIMIGQACEFDYSGCQAVKALREEGFRVVLVNSNPATIMTDPELADATYIEPIEAEYIEKIIEKEKPDALLPTLGGQTALNATLDLDEKGIIAKHGLKLIGASIDAIKTAEDREDFKHALDRCGLAYARSRIARNMADGRAAAQEIGYPLILRPSRTLGGSGGAIVRSADELDAKLEMGFELSPINELLIEESLIGWKEIELEVMRDHAGNGVIVCGIENIDPMGVHTGDSITVAPIQTLTDKEYQQLRNAALAIMDEIGVDTGGANVQFAIDPATGRYIVIEMNPRVSRSSALASKATGFPIARIAAKLAIGYRLDELPNEITGATPACFEPAIDYVVVKIPRFDFEKFAGADTSLGTQMKSVGEVMAMGRNLPEALNKAARALETGQTGITGDRQETRLSERGLIKGLRELSHRRLFRAAEALRRGLPFDDILRLTQYDPWFLGQMGRVITAEKKLEGHSAETLPAEHIRSAKRLGISDARIAEIAGVQQRVIRAIRRANRIRPVYKTVDTCAAEFAANTPYLYSTYDRESEAPPTGRKKVMILGSGPNRIGQGVEFDYCCVHAVQGLKQAGYETIMVNCNPETVSTDFDTADRLYFEPLTEEDVLEIVDRERPDGVIVQYGGQTPLKLADALEQAGMPIIGTPVAAIDLAEDRERFRDLIEELGLRQSASGLATNPREAHAEAARIGFPVLVRPSFVLGGRAMAIIHSHDQLDEYFEDSVAVSHDRPVLIDRFLDDAIEVDVDAVADGEQVIVCGILEHIERAGVHSGDSAFSLPHQTLRAEVVDEIEHATKRLAKAIGVRGLMNVQFAVTGGTRVYVLEVNPRASRSVPFISKATGVPWARIAARVMAGETLDQIAEGGDYRWFLHYADYASAIAKLKGVAVKEAVLPFIKMRGCDPLLGPEMRSTGESMGISTSMADSYWRAQIAANVRLPESGGVMITVRDEDKRAAIQVAKALHEQDYRLYATDGTAEALREHGLPVAHVNKVRQGSPHTIDLIDKGDVGMVINTPQGNAQVYDCRRIRIAVAEQDLPLFTQMSAARATAEALADHREGKEIKVAPIQHWTRT
ncbi:MAG: carbamoyl-phosphate synthase large subunit [Alphaproteobacteria bacterium]